MAVITHFNRNICNNKNNILSQIAYNDIFTLGVPQSLSQFPTRDLYHLTIIHSPVLFNPKFDCELMYHCMQTMYQLAPRSSLSLSTQSFVRYLFKSILYECTKYDCNRQSFILFSSTSTFVYDLAWNVVRINFVDVDMIRVGIAPDAITDRL